MFLKNVSTSPERMLSHPRRRC